MEHISLSKETACNVITCRAAVAWTTNAPLSMEIIEVDPPKAGEVRVKVTSGSTCLVLGLGGIGCAIVIACKASGASRIIGVDINEQKFPRARALGATECLNPNKLKKPVHEVVMEMTGIGVDFAFEAIGLIETMVTALKSCHVSYGVCVIMGVAPSDSQLSFDPMVLLPGRTLKSSIMGDYKTRDAIPKLVTDYMLKKFNIDSLITHTLPFKKINEGFEVLRKGNCIRCVLLF